MPRHPLSSLPADAADRLRRLGGIPEHQIPRILDALSNDSLNLTRPDAFARAAAKLSPPDEKGHMRWTGRIPSDRRRPIIMVNGIRMDGARFARLATGMPELDPNIPLHRNSLVCHIEECFAPAHFVEGRPRVDTTPALSHLYTLWGARDPAPEYPYPTRWDISSQPGIPLCALGHVLKVYDRRKSSAYCAECYVPHAEWHKRSSARGERWKVRGPDAVEDFILAEYRTLPNPEEQLPALVQRWERMDAYYEDNPTSDLSPNEVFSMFFDYSDLTQTDDEHAMTMQEAVAGMFDDEMDAFGLPSSA